MLWQRLGLSSATSAITSLPWFQTTRPSWMWRSRAMIHGSRQSVDHRHRHARYTSSIVSLIMTAVCNRTGHYIFALWFLLLLSFYLFSSPILSRHRLDVVPYFYTWCGPSANLECRSETCCMQVAGNAGPKKSPKSRHLGTITQLYVAISSQLRHVSTIGKKLVKQQYLLHMSSQYGKHWPTNGWDRFGCLGHPS